MFPFNTPNTSPQSNTEFVISNHVTVQVAAELTGCSNQYLRRMLRSWHAEWSQNRSNVADRDAIPGNLPVARRENLRPPFRVQIKYHPIISLNSGIIARNYLVIRSIFGLPIPKDQHRGITDPTHVGWR